MSGVSSSRLVFFFPMAAETRRHRTRAKRLRTSLRFGVGRMEGFLKDHQNPGDYMLHSRGYSVEWCSSCAKTPGGRPSGFQTVEAMLSELWATVGLLVEFL